MDDVNPGAVESTGVQRVRQAYDYILILTFLLVITVPGFVLFWHSAMTVSNAEQRTLAALPTLPRSISEAQEYPSGFDAFVSDHFGFREPLVQWNNKVHVALNVSPSPSVIVGKNGWFFLEDTVGRLVDHNRGAWPFSEGELNAYVAVLEQRKRYLASLNIPVVYLIPPDKQSIYPEVLPDWVHLVGQSRYQQFIEAMNAQGLAVVDVYGPLVASKRQGVDTYRQTDTHWNCRGAWIAYQQVMPVIAAAGVNGTHVVSDSEVLIMDIPDGPAGDLVGNMLHLADSIQEHKNNYCTLHNVRETTATRLADGRSESWNRLAPPSEESWLYARADGVKGSRALVFQDSFAADLLLFFVNSFDEVIYIGNNGVTFDPALIQRYHPDVVIYEFVERNLGGVINNSLLQRFMASKPAAQLSP